MTVATRKGERGNGRNRIAEDLLLVTSLPDRKRKRVFKLLAMLPDAQNFAEYQEIALAIGEILAKADRIYPTGTTAKLEDGISSAAQATVAAYYAETGKAIRKRRKELGLTQEKLAELSGLPQSHICRLETGKHAPTAVTIERIAEALGTTPSKLDLLYD